MAGAHGWQRDAVAIHRAEVNTQQAFQSAYEHHRAGRLAQAEAAAREVVAAQPGHADALHLLGVIAGQMGRATDAAEWLRRAVECRGDDPEFRKNLGVALKSSGFAEEAIAEFRAAVALKPDYAEAHMILGNTLYQAARPGEAIAAYRCATELAPEAPETHSQLGNALFAIGRHEEAITSYRAALRLRPAFATACFNLGVALRAAGRREEAIAALREVLRLAPGHAKAAAHLGDTLREQERLAENIAAYRDALNLKPDSPDVKHLQAALAGDGSATTAPESFVRNMFDAYAADFDADLTGNLGYRVPEMLLEAVTVAVPGRRLDVLDLGCGTGLCGAQFRPVADKLVGVDLSPAMLAKAEARKVYDRLITGEITEVMREFENAFDVLLAADVFVYIGDLDSTFAAAARTLRAGGLFAFSVERHDGEGFLLNSRVRFAHSLAYVRKVAAAHSFTEVHVREIAVRSIGASDARGWIVVLGK